MGMKTTKPRRPFGGERARFRPWRRGSLEYVVWPTGIAGDERRQVTIDISDVLELKRQAVAIYQSQLGLLVTDDPSGFILPGHVLSLATQPAENFLESELIQWPLPPNPLTTTVIERESGALTITFFGEEPKPARTSPTWPTVSVIIPTHNRSQWVVRAVKSALSQTVVQQLEIIVIDDGSTDDTEAALSRYRDKIHYHKQTNQGVVAARNNGIHLARGEFIAFLDSDDIWLPWKIEAQLACFAIKPDLALVWTNAVLIDDQQNYIYSDYVRAYVAYRFFRDDHRFGTDITLDVYQAELPLFLQAHFKIGDLSSSMFMGNVIVTPTVLIRREILKKSGVFDPELGQANEDYDLYWRICEQGHVGFLDLPAVRIGRPREGGLGRDYSALAISDLIAISKYCRRHPDGPTLHKALIAHRLAEVHSRITLTQFEEDNRWMVRKHAFIAICQGAKLHRVYFCFVLAFLPLSLTKLVRRIVRRRAHKNVSSVLLPEVDPDRETAGAVF